MGRGPESRDSRPVEDYLARPTFHDAIRMLSTAAIYGLLASVGLLVYLW